MSLVRVWNITDDSRTDVVSHTRMVLGKVVKPGRSVMVDQQRLQSATKTLKEISAGLLYVGDVLPAEYLTQKKPIRAIADARRIDKAGNQSGEKVTVSLGHGQFPGTAIVEDAVKKVEVTLSDEPKIETTETKIETTDSEWNKKRKR
jgi:hypothetical protein